MTFGGLLIYSKDEVSNSNLSLTRLWEATFDGCRWFKAPGCPPQENCYIFLN